MQRYQPRLLAFCRHMLGSQEDAEDVLQEVFAASFNAICADDRPINARPWLYRIARNRCLNHLRRPQPAGQDSMDVFERDGGTTTADTVHKREEFRHIVADVQELPETQRTALLLREIDALSYEQIAEAMDTTVPSVKSLLVRARVALAEAAEARLLTCAEVRLELGQVAEGITRSTAPVRRHLKGCERCRTFKGELRKTSRALAAIYPIGPLLFMKKLWVAKIGASAGASAAASSGGGAAAGAGVAGATAAAAGGITAGGAVSAGISTVASKAAAGMAAAALVTAGAVEVKHATEPRTGPDPAAAQVVIAPPVAPVGRPAGAGEASADRGEAGEGGEGGGQAEEEAGAAGRRGGAPGRAGAGRGAGRPGGAGPGAGGGLHGDPASARGGDAHDRTTRRRAHRADHAAGRDHHRARAAAARAARGRARSGHRIGRTAAASAASARPVEPAAANRFPAGAGTLPAAMIDFDDFLKVDIRVGRITRVEEFPEARKPAWKLWLDFGPEIGEKRSSAQITNYTREELEGSLVVAVVNFPPRQIGPVRSEVLVLGVPDEEGRVILLRPTSDVPLGGRMF